MASLNPYLIALITFLLVTVLGELDSVHGVGRLDRVPFLDKPTLDSP